MNRINIRELKEELSIAEEFEGELKAKRRRIEESLVPPILRFFDKLKRMEVIKDILLQEAFSSGREQMFKMLEWGATRVKLMKTWLTRMRRKGRKKTMLKMKPPGKNPSAGWQLMTSHFPCLAS